MTLLQDSLGESLFHAWLSIVLMAGEMEETAVYRHTYTIGRTLLHPRYKTLLHHRYRTLLHHRKDTPTP